MHKIYAYTVTDMILTSRKHLLVLLLHLLCRIKPLTSQSTEIPILNPSSRKTRQISVHNTTGGLDSSYD